MTCLIFMPFMMVMMVIMVMVMMMMTKIIFGIRSELRRWRDRSGDLE